MKKYCMFYGCRVILLLFTAGVFHPVSKAQQAIKSAKTVTFKKHILGRKFIAEGVAVGDVNNDGSIDILAGNCWFEAPHWKQHLIHTDTADHLPGYSTTFINFCMDVNNDGWADLIRFDQPGGVCVWYENPKNKEGLWRMHTISKTAGNETPLSVDMDKDGRMDLICNDVLAKEVVWFKSPVGKGDTLWQRFVISSDSLRATERYTHGLGWGDVNKDGRNDVLIKSGWWEAPPDVRNTNWKFHTADFGQDCANMFVLDVDGDGDQDIITSSAHDYGIWWHEQQNNNGTIVWVTHEISRLFSESHALALQDMNSDGHPDLVTGKRYFAHNGGDPGGMEPAVLYWYEYKPGKVPLWTPHEIDDDSGVGTNFVVKDINKDGLPDIIISNKKGVFFFEHLKN